MSWSSVLSLISISGSSNPRARPGVSYTVPRRRTHWLYGTEYRVEWSSCCQTGPWFVMTLCIQPGCSGSLHTLDYFSQGVFTLLTSSYPAFDDPVCQRTRVDSTCVVTLGLTRS